MMRREGSAGVITRFVTRRIRNSLRASLLLVLAVASASAILPQRAAADDGSIVGQWCRTDFPDDNVQIEITNSAFTFTKPVSSDGHLESFPGHASGAKGSFAGDECPWCTKKSSYSATTAIEVGLTGPNTAHFTMQHTTIKDGKTTVSPTNDNTMKRCGVSAGSAQTATVPGTQTKRYPDAKKCLKAVKTNIGPVFNTDRGYENACNYPIQAFDCGISSGVNLCDEFNRHAAQGEQLLQPHQVIGVYPRHIYGACPVPAFPVGRFDGSNVQYHCEATPVDESGTRGTTTSGGSQ